ncbi:type II toxin-antitoxin system ParD family antitoxin [bacterium]|nr:type II toxin-antitoxin system ParD family antitoxin [bacterium]
MTRLIVELPEQIKEYVDEQVRTGTFPGSNEYICELIRADQERRAAAELEMQLLQGLESGEAVEWTSDSASSIRQAVRARGRKAGVD